MNWFRVKRKLEYSCCKIEVKWVFSSSKFEIDEAATKMAKMGEIKQHLFFPAPSFDSSSIEFSPLMPAECFLFRFPNPKQWTSSGKIWTAKRNCRSKLLLEHPIACDFDVGTMRRDGARNWRKEEGRVGMQRGIVGREVDTLGRTFSPFSALIMCALNLVLLSYFPNFSGCHASD